MASGANYFLESGLKPTNKVGERLVLRRETLREKCLETGALVKEQVDMSRKQFRIKKVGCPGWDEVVCVALIGRRTRGFYFSTLI